MTVNPRIEKKALREIDEQKVGSRWHMIVYEYTEQQERPGIDFSVFTHKYGYEVREDGEIVATAAGFMSGARAASLAGLVLSVRLAAMLEEQDT